MGTSRIKPGKKVSYESEKKKGKEKGGDVGQVKTFPLQFTNRSPS